MRLSSVTQASTLLTLSALFLTAEAQSRRRISVRTYRTNYRVDTWDDGRDELYRVTYWKFGLKSVYTFDAGGHVRTLTARDTLYTFDLADPSRMLMGSTEGAIEDVETDLTPAIDCATCETTWNTLCDVGLTEVCFLNDNNPTDFDNDAANSVRRFCGAVGAACERTASDVCGNQCEQGDCDPNPCQFGGTCSADPAGGHTCSCANDYGGLSCQIDTAPLDTFFIEVEFIGTWTNARRAAFQSAADRWSEVVTHVPCGGTTEFPAGRLLISATLQEIDGFGGVLGFAGPTAVWRGCSTISAEGEMTFDIDDVSSLEADGSFGGVILHEMGHVIGVGTLWGNDFGQCTTCRETGDPAWLCPAALSTFADLGGSGADIVELEGGTGTSCAHLDEDIFVDELMTGFVDNPMFLSKMTAAILEDIAYVVDSSMVDAYVLPSERGGALNADMTTPRVNDTTVETIIRILDEDGDVFEEVGGVGMQF